MQNYFNSLKENLYLQLKFPINHSYLEKTIDLFFKFLELPNNLKEHIDLKIGAKHRRGDIGLKHRESTDDIYRDSKDFFHFHPLIFEEYADFLKANPVINEFMQHAQPIWKAAYNLAYQIIKSFDASFPGTSDKIFDTNEVHILLRFLRYQWANSDKYLAKPHFDAGSFTLAIAESSPGLRIGKGPTDLEIVPHEANQAIFMVSSNFKKIIDTDELSPGWHDVIQLDKTQLGKPCARWAIVAFIEGHDVEALSRSETHKWHVG